MAREGPCYQSTHSYSVDGLILIGYMLNIPQLILGLFKRARCEVGFLIRSHHALGLHDILRDERLRIGPVAQSMLE